MCVCVCARVCARVHTCMCMLMTRTFKKLLPLKQLNACLCLSYTQCFSVSVGPFTPSQKSEKGELKQRCGGDKVERKKTRVKSVGESSNRKLRRSSSEGSA